MSISNFIILTNLFILYQVFSAMKIIKEFICFKAFRSEINKGLKNLSDKAFINQRLFV